MLIHTVCAGAEQNKAAPNTPDIFGHPHPEELASDSNSDILLALRDANPPNLNAFINKDLSIDEASDGSYESSDDEIISSSEAESESNGPAELLPMVTLNQEACLYDILLTSLINFRYILGGSSSTRELAHASTKIKER